MAKLITSRSPIAKRFIELEHNKTEDFLTSLVCLAKDFETGEEYEIDPLLFVADGDVPVRLMPSQSADVIGSASVAITEGAFENRVLISIPNEILNAFPSRTIYFSVLYEALFIVQFKIKIIDVA